ncbi:hypothetical protein F5Y14DRAFT_19005 [Nemania sp. NC0429]|nr:hypothetical protein F5Y14DRAFT_19005 [Nemania sp. NC0429]
MIFLGAPFQGSELAVYGTWIAQVAGLDESLLCILEKDNLHLHGISRDFWASYGKRDIVCFYETKDAEYGPWRQRVVDPQSATIQGKRMIYLDTDHSGLGKFHGTDDENYMLLLPEIRSMVERAPSAMASRQSTTVPTGTDIPQDQVKQNGHWVVPFGRNRQFVGREPILEQLLAMVPPSVEEDNCQRTAIEGLGGIGKTQIALEVAFQVRHMHPDCSIFWVPAVDISSFENAYRKIGQELGVQGINEDKADVKVLVREALNCGRAGQWLLIIDNADDIELFFGDANLSKYLPSSHKGSIVFTTRDHKATVELSAAPITVGKLDRSESQKLLEKNLKKAQLRNTEDTTKLLDFLEDLALAIKQASTFMAKEGVSTAEYLEFCQSSETSAMNLLSEDFRDLYRYDGIPNPVVKTFCISFEKISTHHPLAANYMRFMSFLSDKDIPRSLLPPAEKLEEAKAIGTLKGYAFITEQEEGGIYDIHRLVRLSMLNWLTNTGCRQEWATKVSQRLVEVFPWPDDKNIILRMRYFPHVQNLRNFLVDTNDTTTKVTLLWKLSQSFSDLGRYTEAEDMLRKALDLRKNAQGEEGVGKLGIMSALASVLYNQLRAKEAEEILRHTTLAQRKAMHETDIYDIVREMRLLALTLDLQGNFEESESIQWQALKHMKEMLAKKQPGNNAVDTHSIHMDTSNSFAFYKEAEELHQRAHETDRVLEKEALYLLADFVHGRYIQNRYEESEQMLRQLLPLVRMSLGNSCSLAISIMVSLGQSIFLQKAKTKEAVEILRHALVLGQQMRGEAHPFTQHTKEILGIALSLDGNSKEAVKVLHQVLVLQQKLQGEAHLDTLHTMYSLGDVLYREGDHKEAVKILHQALGLAQKEHGKAHPATLDISARLEFVLANANHDAEDQLDNVVTGN